MGILKGYVDSYVSIITKILNNSLERGCSKPTKLPEVTLAFKKEGELSKEIIALLVFIPHAVNIFDNNLQPNKSFFIKVFATFNRILQ